MSNIIVCSEPLAERTVSGEPDAAHLAATPFDRASGDGLNIAGDLACLSPVVARHFGHENAPFGVSLLAALGDDAANPRGNHAQTIHRVMEESGVDTSLLFTVPGTLTGAYTIRVTPSDGEASGEKKSYVYHDRHDAAMRCLFEECMPQRDEKLAQALERFAPGERNYFVVTGIAASRPKTSEDFDRLLETVRQAKDAGATIVFDTNNRLRLWQDENDGVADDAWSRPGYKPVNERSAAQADALAEQRMDKLFELSDIVFVTHPDDTRSHRWVSAVDVGSKLMKWFPEIRTVVVKEGEKGAVAFNRNEEQETELIRQPAIPIPEGRRMVDSSGAGDSMAAAFLLAQSHGASVREALALGALAGSIEVQYPGGLFPKGEALDRFAAAMPGVLAQARAQGGLVGARLETPLE